MPNAPYQPVAGFNAQTGRFYNLKFNDQGNIVIIGGIQDITFSEQTGVRGYVGEVGSDHKEPDFQMRQGSGTINRLTLNRRKIRDVFAGGDSSITDIDFRQFQFIIEADYQEAFVAPGSLVGTPTAQGGLYKEILNDVMFTTLTFSLSDPTSLSRESVNFIYTVPGQVPASETILQAF